MEVLADVGKDSVRGKPRPAKEVRSTLTVLCAMAKVVVLSDSYNRVAHRKSAVTKRNVILRRLNLNFSRIVLVS